MRSIESICATAGEDVPSDTRPLTAPIYQNSVFEVDSLEQIDAIYRGATDGYLYSREFNPNVMILEDVMAQLEGGDDHFGGLPVLHVGTAPARQIELQRLQEHFGGIHLAFLAGLAVGGDDLVAQAA